MFLENSRVEQRVCFFFRYTSRTDGFFRRFHLRKTGESYVNCTEINCLRASCVSYIRSVGYTEFSYSFSQEHQTHP
jgi:hypothetical protein